MSFAAFETAITSPELRCVASHWNSARAARPMPSWTDLRPSKIASHLGIIWSYRYDRDTNTMIGRLAGDEIEQIFGKTFRGTPMDGLYPPDQYPLVFARFRRVVCDPALYLEHGKVFQSVDHFGFGERIALPLAQDGLTGDGIIGATVYETFSNSVPPPLPDRVQWYSPTSEEVLA